VFATLLHERFIANPQLAKFWADSAMERMFHPASFCGKTVVTSVLTASVDPSTTEAVKTPATPKSATKRRSSRRFDGIV
jgi:hypothetical protein